VCVCRRWASSTEPTFGCRNKNPLEWRDGALACGTNHHEGLAVVCTLSPSLSLLLLKSHGVVEPVVLFSSP
jgi:hypothetical protein